MRLELVRSRGTRRTVVRISVPRLVFFDQSRPIRLLIKFMKDKRLRRPVTWTFRPAPKTDVAFWFRFITADFSLKWTYSAYGHVKRWLAELAYLSALEAACGSLRHRRTTRGALAT